MLSESLKLFELIRQKKKKCCDYTSWTYFFLQCSHHLIQTLFWLY